jgi:type I restriction-modification system DNA methylase subunit
MNAPELGLDDSRQKARYGESRQHQELFIPALLEKAARDYTITGPEQDRAYEIIKKWAGLDEAGKLLKQKETTLQGEFLSEVFGEALGYTLFSKGLETWNLWPQFPVNGGSADAAIGVFQHDKESNPTAIIELKGPKINLDRDRSQGRTAIQQSWDYLNAMPECQWGIVCNYVSFRVYHRERSNREYQLFILSDLSRRGEFQKFYYVLQREGLLPDRPKTLPRAEKLLRETGEQQQRVGDELYGFYDRSREELIHHLLNPPHRKTREQAIRIAQKLIDRIIFVAFCEDRGLLPNNSIQKAYSQIAGFTKYTNPKWQNFLQLFRFLDTGGKSHDIPAYNGGLFREDPEVDNLNLDDKWTVPFSRIASYDFRNEINVEILGKLFERSIKDIERLLLGGPLGDYSDTDQPPKMDKSAVRKRQGVYYTPAEFTKFIVERVIGKMVDERIGSVAESHGLKIEEAITANPDQAREKFWRDCLSEMRQIKIVDPACGSGAFLIAAYDLLEEKYLEIVDHILHHSGKKTDNLIDSVGDYILNDNLFGVDLSAEAVEITQLSLWLRSAKRGKPLSDLSKNIVCGNSLVSNSSVHPRALDWESAFPDIFNRKEHGFDCVIGNPPWERLKLQEREFFDTIDTDIASAVDAATRRRLIKELKDSQPDIHLRYEEAKDAADKTLEYVRRSGRYPLTGRGDINTYSVFAELAHTIVGHHGLVGLLLPTGIATDDTTKEFFASVAGKGRLSGLYDFENKAPIFPDVHLSFKFCAFLFNGVDRKSQSADFVFFARYMSELREADRHIKLTPKDIALFNPNTHTCPIFRTQRDMKITKAIYQRVPVLVEESRGEKGNPWGVRFMRMFDQTNDAELFHTADKLMADGFKLTGNRWKKGKKIFLPLYEGKMIQMYDHRAAGVVIEKDNWMRQGQTSDSTSAQHQKSEFCVIPRWWVDEKNVLEALKDKRPAFLGFKDITSPTNTRTMIASFIPIVATANSVIVVLADEQKSLRVEACLLANANSIVLDFIARQKVGGLHLNYFIVEQLPIYSPDYYSTRCPWNKKLTLEKWISDRVLKLTCTSDDMIPLAEAAGFEEKVHKWNPEERGRLMAELDAAYFLLYGVERDDAEYILSTFSGMEEKPEGFFGDTSARSLILHYYDQLGADSSGH